MVTALVVRTDGRRTIIANGKTFRNYIISCPVPEVVLGIVNNRKFKLTHVSVHPGII